MGSICQILPVLQGYEFQGKRFVFSHSSVSDLGQQRRCRAFLPDALGNANSIHVSKVSLLIFVSFSKYIPSFGGLLTTDSLPGQPSSSEFYHTHIQYLPRAPELRTFQDWLSYGSKYTRIASGGSIYMLLILSGLNLRWPIAKVRGKVVYDIATMLRRPKTTGKGNSPLPSR